MPIEHVTLNSRWLDRERLRDGGDHPLGDAEPAAIPAMLGDEQDELVATEARDGVAVPDARGEALADDLQHLVADVVPQAVVDQLEVVEIDERHAARASVPMGDAQALLEPVAQQVAVGEAGQRVVIGLMLELLLVALDLGDVVLDADEVRDLVRPRVAHRRHVQHVPEETAVLAVVAEQRPPVRLLGDRAPDLLELRLVAVGALQQAAVAPDHVVAAIARHLLERVIDVDDRHLRIGGAHDQHGVDARLDGAIAQAKRFLGFELERAFLGIVQRAPHRRGQPGKIGLEDVVVGAAAQGLDRRFFADRPDTKMNGTSGLSSRSTLSAERPSNRGIAKSDSTTVGSNSLHARRRSSSVSTRRQSNVRPPRFNSRTVSSVSAMLSSIRRTRIGYVGILSVKPPSAPRRESG
jgi:hypothetical protein